jgi:2-dehydro-3-deoxygluconokinase
LHYDDEIQALKFASEACALKNTLQGDVKMVKVEDVEKLVEGDNSGSIKR